MMQENRSRDIDKKQLQREQDHLRRPPRLSGVIHKKGITPEKKVKGRSYTLRTLVR